MVLSNCVERLSYLQASETADTYHDRIPSAGVCSNGLEVWGVAACWVLERTARVAQIRCDESVDMFDCACMS